MQYICRRDNMKQKQIGLFINKCRENKKITIEEFAQKLNTTPRLVKKWEKGKKIPSIDYLPKISKILNVPIIDILKGDKVKDDNDFLLALDYYIKKITSFKKDSLMRSFIFESNSSSRSKIFCFLNNLFHFFDV